METMRDYYEKPLKRGEHIPYEDLYRYYIDENHSKQETMQYFNVKSSKFEND